jgi:hypothetical protein
MIFAHLLFADKLTELRNSTLLVFAMTNAIWLILISTLVTKSSLNVLGTNFLGKLFLPMPLQLIMLVSALVQISLLKFGTRLEKMHS